MLLKTLLLIILSCVLALNSKAQPLADLKDQLLDNATSFSPAPLESACQANYYTPAVDVLDLGEKVYLFLRIRGHLQKSGQPFMNATIRPNGPNASLVIVNMGDSEENQFNNLFTINLQRRLPQSVAMRFEFKR